MAAKYGNSCQNPQRFGSFTKFVQMIVWCCFLENYATVHRWSQVFDLALDLKSC